MLASAALLVAGAAINAAGIRNPSPAELASAADGTAAAG
jgi:hypothetical protein